MKKYALLTSAASLLIASSAMAADLPARVAAPAPVPVAPAFTWTGFYVGVNAGYGGNNFEYPISVTTPTETPTITAQTSSANAKLKLNSSGFLGGAQIGYNYQIGAFVIGAEADFAFANIDGKLDISGSSDIAPLLGSAGATVGSEIENLGTVRLRAGYAWQRALFYVTGGWAYGDVKTTLSAGLSQVMGPSMGLGYSKTNMQSGWTLGAGVEYALTNNITFKTEYLYVDLGKDTVYANTYQSGVAVNWDAEATAHIVRVGVNYKF